MSLHGGAQEGVGCKRVSGDLLEVVDRGVYMTGCRGACWERVRLGCDVGNQSWPDYPTFEACLVLFRCRIKRTKSRKTKVQNWQYFPTVVLEDERNSRGCKSECYDR